MNYVFYYSGIFHQGYEAQIAWKDNDLWERYYSIYRLNKRMQSVEYMWGMAQMRGTPWTLYETDISCFVNICYILKLHIIVIVGAQILKFQEIVRTVVLASFMTDFNKIDWLRTVFGQSKCNAYVYTPKRQPLQLTQYNL